MGRAHGSGVGNYSHWFIHGSNGNHKNRIAFFILRKVFFCTHDHVIVITAAPFQPYCPLFVFNSEQSRGGYICFAAASGQINADGVFAVFHINSYGICGKCCRCIFCFFTVLIFISCKSRFDQIIIGKCDQQSILRQRGRIKQKRKISPDFCGSLNVIRGDGFVEGFQRQNMFLPLQINVSCDGVIFYSNSGICPGKNFGVGQNFYGITALFDVTGINGQHAVFFYGLRIGHGSERRKQGSSQRGCQKCF